MAIEKFPMLLLIQPLGNLVGFRTYKWKQKGGSKQAKKVHIGRKDGRMEGRGERGWENEGKKIGEGGREEGRVEGKEGAKSTCR